MQFVRDTTRRLVMTLAYVLFGVLLVVSAPLWAPVTFVIDHVRKQSYLRCIAFFTHFIWTGLFYLTQAQLYWVWKGGPFRDGGMLHTVRLRRAAQVGSAPAGGAMRPYRLDCMEGAEEALAEPGPLLLLSRHVSFGDTILPFKIFEKRLPFQPRYVMKAGAGLGPCTTWWAAPSPTPPVLGDGQPGPGDRRGPEAASTAPAPPTWWSASTPRARGSPPEARLILERLRAKGGQR
ncbi:MAG: hypothetical protein R3F43_29300 [bacterium]